MFDVRRSIIARAAYDAIIVDLRITGSYPKEALQELANLKHLMNDARGAALDPLTRPTRRIRRNYRPSAPRAGSTEAPSSGGRSRRAG